MGKVNFCDLERIEFVKGCFSSSGRLAVENNNQTHEIKVLRFNRLLSFLYLITKPIASLFWVPVNVKIEGGECLAYLKVSEVVQKVGLLNQSKAGLQKELLDLAQQVSKKALTVLADNLVELTESDEGYTFSLGAVNFSIHITGSGIRFEDVDYTNVQDLFSRTIHSKIKDYNDQSLRIVLRREYPNEIVVQGAQGDLSLQIFDQNLPVEVSYKGFKCGDEEFASVQEFIEGKVFAALREGYLSKLNVLDGFEGFTFNNNTLSFKDCHFAVEIDHQGIKWNEKKYKNIDLLFKDLYFEVISSWGDRSKCISDVEKRHDYFSLLLNVFSSVQRHNFTYANGKIVYGEDSFSLDGFFEELENLWKDGVLDFIEEFLEKRGRRHLDNFNPETLEFKVGDRIFNFSMDFKKKGIVFDNKEYLLMDALKEQLKLIIVESAAEKIKRVGTSVFSQWITKYDQDFVAHAVFQEKGVEKIFESKAVFPGEYILRNQKRVEYEKGSQYGQRGVSELPDLSQEEIKEIEDKVEKLGPNYGFSLNDDWKDGVVVKQQNLLKRGDLFRNCLNVIGEKHGTDGNYVLLAYEMQLKEEERFDVFLSSVYLQLKSDSENTGHLRNKRAKEIVLENEGKELYEKLLVCRERLFNFNKLNFDIRAVANKVAWSYGKVAILRGKKEQVIGYDQGSEKILLPPWRNGGKFFALELEQEDTIVVGPKEIKDKYYDEKEHQNIKMVTFEEMTDEELDYLQVPAEFYEK